MPAGPVPGVRSQPMRPSHRRSPLYGPVPQQPTAPTTPQGGGRPSPAAKARRDLPAVLQGSAKRRATRLRLAPGARRCPTPIGWLRGPNAPSPWNPPAGRASGARHERGVLPRARRPGTRRASRSESGGRKQTFGRYPARRFRWIHSRWPKALPCSLPDQRLRSSNLAGSRKRGDDPVALCRPQGRCPGRRPAPGILPPAGRRSASSAAGAAPSSRRCAGGWRGRV